VTIKSPEEKCLPVPVGGVDRHHVGVTILADRRAARNTFQIANKVIRLTTAIKEVTGPDFVKCLHNPILAVFD